MQLFAKSIERHFGIQSNNFDSNHFNEVNQFTEDNYEYFYPPEDPNDYRSDMDDDHDLVADIDSDTLIAGRRFTPVGEGGSGRRPLPPQSLNILVGLTLKLLSLYCIGGLV